MFNRVLFTVEEAREQVSKVNFKATSRLQKILNKKFSKFRRLVYKNIRITSAQGYTSTSINPCQWFNRNVSYTRTSNIETTIFTKYVEEFRKKIIQELTDWGYHVPESPYETICIYWEIK